MPVILCGVLGMFGLVISILIASSLGERTALHTNFLYLGAGLAMGLCGLSAG